MTCPTSYLHTSITLSHLSTKEFRPCQEPQVLGVSRSFPHRYFRSPHPGSGSAPSASTLAVQAPPPSRQSLPPRRRAQAPPFPGRDCGQARFPAPSDAAASIPTLARPRTFQTGPFRHYLALCQASLFPASTPNPTPLLVLYRQTPLFRLPAPYSC